MKRKQTSVNHLTASLIGLIASALALLLAVPGSAQAAPGCDPGKPQCPPLLAQFSSYGYGGGQTTNPAAMATDPVSGHVFVGGSHRIVEFDAVGGFVKASGWGVVASGPGNEPRNEIQRVIVDATSGEFRLKSGFEQVTPPIPHDASAAELQSALDALPASPNRIPYAVVPGPGGLLVSGPVGGPWQIEFAGANADLDFRELEVVSSTLSGGAGAEVTTVQPGANPEVCVAADGDVCREAQEGIAPGQINSLKGIAVDDAGNLWARESVPFSSSSQRLQKLSQDGDFILMIGGEVNKTKVAEREEQEANSEPITITEAEENLCTATSGDECRGGVAGAGEGEFAQGSPFPHATVALGPGGTIYVGDQNRIQVFEQDGSFKEAIPLAGGGITKSLTVTPDGRLYVISENVLEEFSNGNFLKESRVVREIGPAGEELGRLGGEWGEGLKTPRDPTLLASDAEGNVYVAGKVVYDVRAKESDPPKFREIGEVVAFDAAGEMISFESSRAGFAATGSDRAEPVSLATNVSEEGGSEPGPVYVGRYFLDQFEEASGHQSYVRAYGRQFGEPDPELPQIVATYASSVASTDATVEAQINPRFSQETTFRVQYGTGKCSEGGCTAHVPGSPLPLSGAGESNPQVTGPVTLTGLQSGTTYRYRFVAENEVGGPVFGTEGTIRTFRAVGPTAGCANDAVRLGAAAFLPDCRGYEMVSPLDKDGGEVTPLADSTGYPTELTQADPEGGAFTYSAYRAFGDPESAPFNPQYLARRKPDEGWSSRSISPPREGLAIKNLRNQYRAFSEDLSTALLVTDSGPLLDPTALTGYQNLYARDNLSGTYEAQCSVAPPSADPAFFFPEAQGSSADGSRVVFRAVDALTANAAETEQGQVYECVDGAELRLVSELPGGEAHDGGASVGTGAGGEVGRNNGYRMSNIEGAVSRDGSRIFWTATEYGSGPLYVRIGGVSTVPISAGPAQFRIASPDGTRVIYSVAGNLFAASIGDTSSSSELIAGQVDGFMGASEDAELVYFVSREDLDGGGPAQAGRANLYLHRAGPDTDTYIATLAEIDTRQTPPGTAAAPVLTPVALAPYHRSARVSDDGLHAAFTSSASLTSYDNTDLSTGTALTEVFVYDAESEELSCVSCNPSGARPRGANITAPETPFWVAATIPGWQTQHRPSRLLSEDGGRLFFEAVDALALRDTNGAKDVYQWQEAGRGTCTGDSPTYSPEAQGCIDLISSGKSPEGSDLLDVSASGDDVFFKTAASLYGPDPGLIDVYDARVGGGFAPPPPPPGPCEGEACQTPGRSPQPLSAASAAFQGAGNLAPSARKRKPKRCRGSKRKPRREVKASNGTKRRCVATQRGKRNNHGRAGR